MQHITSAATSLNQVNPAIKNVLPHLSGLTVLDIGGGKYDTNKIYATGLGVKLYIYDKFNRPEAENTQALACNPDIIVCNNVLNVIDDGQAMRNVIALCASYQVPCYFTVHEGNKSGIGGISKKECWQRNWKTADYVPILQKYFYSVVCKGKLIICR
ncbi:hypothetical protein [Candidatus Parabeggiatoa sp. HSG14]|uniref:hypothetical protein n=1 Tax=Candidatus Parabeggiatoa sp. HSG14 TaxID=3055593 RepID=UPI0025A75CE0|nr:hypothetical protein [Thiotrichales bacterium HSG14]